MIWNPIAGLDARARGRRSASIPATGSSTWSGTTSTRPPVPPRSRRTRPSTARIQASRTRCPRGLSVDDPGSTRICRFPTTASRTKLAVYYDTRPYDLGSKPARGRSTAAASRPRAERADLDRRSDQGDAPLAVAFAPRASLAKPVVRWEAPSATASCSRAPARLRPRSRTPTPTRACTRRPWSSSSSRPSAAPDPSRRRRGGEGRQQADRLLQLTATRNAGAVSAQFSRLPPQARPAGSSSRDDGTSRSGGVPPRFLAHTTRPPGTYRAASILSLGPGERAARFVEVEALTPDAACEATIAAWPGTSSATSSGRSASSSARSRERVAPRAAEIDESHEFPWDIVELFREHEIFGLLFAEEHGGSGRERCSRSSRSRRSRRSARRAASCSPSRSWARSGQARGLRRRRRRTCRGSRAASGCRPTLTEAGSGSDSAAMRTTAVRDGDEYVLNGGKRFITNAGVANLYTGLRQDRPRRGALGHLGLPRRVGHARLRGREAGAEAGDLGLDDGRADLRRLPHSRREPARRGGRGLQDRDADPRPLTPGVAAQALGIAQGATDYALEYAKTRETMGKPIAQHQLIAAKLADMETETEAARGSSTASGRCAMPASTAPS